MNTINNEKYTYQVICKGSIILGTGCGTCKKCKDELARIMKENELKKIEKENTEKEKNYNFGWICPVCGRGNAPFTKTCICVPIDDKITY